MVERDIIFRDALRESLWDRFNYELDVTEMDPEELIMK